MWLYVKYYQKNNWIKAHIFSQFIFSSVNYVNKSRLKWNTCTGNQKCLFLLWDMNTFGENKINIVLNLGLILDQCQTILPNNKLLLHKCFLLLVLKRPLFTFFHDLIKLIYMVLSTNILLYYVTFIYVIWITNKIYYWLENKSCT